MNEIFGLETTDPISTNVEATGNTEFPSEVEGCIDNILKEVTVETPSEMYTCIPEIKQNDELCHEQIEVESNYMAAHHQILSENRMYMTDEDIRRIEKGPDTIRVVEEGDGYIGLYTRDSVSGKSSIEIVKGGEEQLLRTTQHETNHFFSHQKDLIIPSESGGYTVFRETGLRETEYFHASDNREYLITDTGRGMNEGVTELLTNQQLAERSPELGRSAWLQSGYSQSLEVCSELQDIIGDDVIKNAYFGGRLEELQKSIDGLAGEHGYETLVRAVDQLTYAETEEERLDGITTAQEILCRIYERKNNI